MKWEKLGRIFKADGQFEWMQTHAALPVPVHVEGDIFRVFFSTRDGGNRSNGAYLDIDIRQPDAILDLSAKPVLEPGQLGLFDDCGVSLSSFCPQNGLLYYLGWNLPKTVPFCNRIGAASLSGTRCDRISRLPVLPPSESEPFSFGYPFVMKFGGSYKMWYDTNFEWSSNSTTGYRFTLRSASSVDGINWVRDNVDVLPQEGDEWAISRPWVLEDQGVFKMWYSINTSGKYRIGYAESPDGLAWTRKDDMAGISPSASGWDSDEIEYAAVFDHEGELYMLYNGNGYGKSGLGFAALSR